MSHIENLQQLFVEQLKDVYDAEHQLVDALAELEKKASSQQLKRAFSEHRQITERQARKLERVFAGMGEEPERKTCKGMKGLVAEGKEVIEAEGDDDAIDAGLIAAAQKVEHYEMATYGTLRTFAMQLGREPEARLLQEILDEEAEANEKLTTLATGGINQKAEGGETRGRRSRVDGLLGSLGVGSRGKSKSASGSRSAAGKAGSRSASGTRSAANPSRSTNGKRSTAARSGAGNEGATKEELLEQARDLGIEGRSQMNKAQLRRAVQRHGN